VRSRTARRSRRGSESSTWRWWLERCDDRELAAIASDLNGHSLVAADIARVRAFAMPGVSGRKLL
jgi:hypothetical protein